MRVDSILLVYNIATPSNDYKVVAAVTAED